jgi:tryptophan synthase alpha chain
VAPTTSPTRRKLTVEQSSGFVYQIATAGTTGERGALADTLKSETTALREMTALPICTGFGVSTAEHVRQVCRESDGAIVGSALVRRIQEGIDAGLNRGALADSVERALRELLAGTQAK